MSNKKYIVYMHQLKTDLTKVYIGQTSMTLEQRSGSNGYKYKSCTKFYNAIKKYGWNNFNHIILKDNLSLEEANILEDQLIKQYDSINKGFNLVPGGRNHEWTEEQRQQMKERNLGEKNPNFGKPRSEETKKKIGTANKISQKGKKHTEQTKEKMSKNHKIYKPIICIETNIVYNCPSDAAIGIGKKPSAAGHITEVCQGKRKTAYGFHWRYKENDNE